MTHDGQPVSHDRGIADQRGLGAGSERTQVVQIVVWPHLRANGKPHRSYFDCRVEGGPFLCTSRQPFLQAARELIALGCHPDAILVMRHAGSDVEALKARVAAAARLTVDEHNGTRFASWKPFPSSARKGKKRDEAA